MSIEPAAPLPSGHTAFGASGEAMAVALLLGLGFDIVARNVRPVGGRSRGEIDIVARERGTLVFVEVKTRRRIGPDSAPAEAVDLRKRRQLIYLAQVYLNASRQTDIPVRFDVVEVSGPPGAQKIRLMRNAFDGNDI